MSHYTIRSASSVPADITGPSCVLNTTISLAICFKFTGRPMITFGSAGHFLCLYAFVCASRNLWVTDTTFRYFHLDNAECDSIIPRRLPAGLLQVNLITSAPLFSR